jgi:hypothetical protein
MKHPFILLDGLNFKNFESFIISSFLISSAVNKIIGGLILDFENWNKLQHLINRKNLYYLYGNTFFNLISLNSTKLLLTSVSFSLLCFE